MRLSRERYTAVMGRAELLVSGAEMERILDRLAGAITKVLAERDPVVLCVMNGAVIAVGRLLPRLGFPLTLDYVHATRYRGTTSGGDLQWLHRPAASVRGRYVLVVDDILDAGVTLDAVVKACREDGAANVHTAVLVEKTREHTNNFKADFVGIQLPDRYLFGYGLDYMGYFRNADGIYAVADEDV
ncbi:hypoxanthine-guanine phosphoribosyltransferase [Candidatus Thiosymbion oneisti]|uniref:hypoxanthine-guanine phosphoribosyltransferase n=1 Tax=Candidatus Thiosymbion oneisti TaxID=589554 RepID=UPI000A7F1292|nr:hypoxanthine-guanine phosphoribosyltransferase [Candidatus Thiosymbion oneisti]